MCGRFTLVLGPEDLAEAFGLSEIPPGAGRRYNVAPTQPVLAVTADRPRAAEWLRWGLVPRWAKDPAIASRLINARGETLSEKPAFREAFRHRRCLVLADGFFEWRKEGKARQPYHVRLRSGRPFAMAGLWDSWRQPDGGTLRSCTIVTTEANALVGQLHGRMPVVLPPEDAGRWLDPGPEGRAVLDALVRPLPAELLEAYPVDRRVGSPEQDGPECVEPVGEPLSLAPPRPVGARTEPSQPGLWEGDDLVDGPAAGEEHDQPVEAERRSRRPRH